MVLEFALVVPLLLMILFGVLTYGLWLNDMLSLRQGVREASRQGVVNSFGGTTSCGASYTTVPSADLQRLVCLTKADVASLTGRTYVKVLLPDGWVRGKQLVVCTQVKASRIASPVPLPNDDIIRAVSRMSIEVADPGQVETGGEEAPPAGGSWSWCS
ncbi:MAG: TadE family protein [Nocardioidaceae bacterium]